MMLMATLFGEIVGKYLCKFFFLLLFVFCCTKIAPRMCVCEENETVVCSKIGHLIDENLMEYICHKYSHEKHPTAAIHWLQYRRAN